MVVMHVSILRKQTSISSFFYLFAKINYIYTINATTNPTVAAKRREGGASVGDGDGEEGCGAAGESGRAASTTTTRVATTRTTTNEDRERDIEEGRATRDIEEGRAIAVPKSPASPGYVAMS
jgi:hypothetical protein